MDNLNLTFPDNLFDIVCARHTVIDAKQIYDKLSENGILIVEGVDKYDAWELKELFGRGQAYKDEVSISQIDYENIKKAGFKEVEIEEIIQYEYYETENDLLALLLKTPILDEAPIPPKKVRGIDITKAQGHETTKNDRDVLKVVSVNNGGIKARRIAIITTIGV